MRGGWGSCDILDHWGRGEGEGTINYITVIILLFVRSICLLSHKKVIVVDLFTLLQLLSVMSQACCLALIDACIPMTSAFAGVTCAYTDDGKCVLDPDSEQEQVCS